jgi:cell division transport system ATP-binding protein
MQVIRFSGVYKSYKKGGLALKNVSFSLSKGEFVFLTGPSGAGKSTLLKLIYMGLRPTEGEVRVSGFSSSRIHGREIPKLRRRLGIIFQDFRLLKNRTARENVAFALEVTGAPRAAIAPKVQRTLTAVGLGQKGERYPHELSGGEQQRVAIARALVNDPFILLADEPTGNLDTKTSLDILRILREINSLGMAVLLATHDYTLLAEYPEARVLHLVDGALVSDSASGQPATGGGGSGAAPSGAAVPPLRSSERSAHGEPAPGQPSPFARPLPPVISAPRPESSAAAREPESVPSGAGSS